MVDCSVQKAGEMAPLVIDSVNNCSGGDNCILDAANFLSTDRELAWRPAARGSCAS